MSYGAPVGTISSSISSKSTQFILTGLGAGYGGALTTIDGASYAQSYSNTYKFNKYGEGVWARSFSGGGNKEKIAIDSSENVYVVGSSFVASFDLDGNLRWQKTTATISWQSCTVDKANTFLYIVGSDASYGYIMKLNVADGSVVWSRRASPKIEFRGVDAYTDTGRVAAIGYATNGSVYDTHMVELDSSGSVRYQKRVRYGSSGSFYTFGEGIAYSPTDNAIGAGMLIANSIYNGFTVGFDTSGNQSLLLQLSGNGLFAYYNNVAFDASGYMYISDFNVTNSSGSWGSVYTRFLGSTPEKTVSFQGTSGTLQMFASKIDRTIGMMGNAYYFKLLGDDSIPEGTYGSYTVVEDIPNYSWTGTIQISSSNDSISYSNPGLTVSNGSYTVTSSVPSPGITYLG